MGTPDASKQVLAFVFVLRVELQFVFSVGRSWRVHHLPQITRRQRQYLIVGFHTRVWIFIFLPRDARPDAFGLEDELSHLVLLTVFAGFDVFPAENAPADGTADVADNVLACDEVSWDGFVLVCVRQSWGRELNVTCRSLDKICSAVPACEPFAYDLRCEAQVGRAFGALDVRAVSVEEFVLGWDDDGGC